MKQMWVDEKDREKFKFYARCKGYTMQELFKEIVLKLGIREIDIKMNDKNSGVDDD